MNTTEPGRPDSPFNTTPTEVLNIGGVAIPGQWITDDKFMSVAGDVYVKSGDKWHVLVRVKPIVTRLPGWVPGFVEPTEKHK